MTTDNTSAENKTRSITVHIGRDVSEYDTFTIDVPAGVGVDEIKRLALMAVDDYVCNDSDAFMEGVTDYSNSHGLRIQNLRDENNDDLVDRIVPIDSGYFEMGGTLSRAAHRLEQGQLTENQFILEALNSVYRNSPNPENGLLTKAFIASYEEAAQEDSRQKADQIKSNHGGIISQETGPVILTMKNDYGDMANVTVQPPSVLSEDQVFYPYDGGIGGAALVSRTEERITVIWDDGQQARYEGVSAFMEDTGLVKVGMREGDYEKGLEIIRRIQEFLPREEADSSFSMPFVQEQEGEGVSRQDRLNGD